jgi:bifunctional enzyme CysN/CysC
MSNAIVPDDDQLAPVESISSVRDTQTVANGERRNTRPRTGGIRIVEPGAIIWLTGLSGAGKTTLAIHTESRLANIGYAVRRLDGDELRRTISADLGFSIEHRHEQARRAASAASQLANAGFVVLVSLISPFASDRAAARSITPRLFHEVYVDAPLQVCERRDPRQLYRRARHGDIADFTGISSPYEAPDNPDLRVDTDALDVVASTERLVRYITAHVSPAVDSLPLPVARITARRALG